MKLKTLNVISIVAILIAFVIGPMEKSNASAIQSSMNLEGQKVKEKYTDLADSKIEQGEIIVHNEVKETQTEFVVSSKGSNNAKQYSVYKQFVNESAYLHQMVIIFSEEEVVAIKENIISEVGTEDVHLKSYDNNEIAIDETYTKDYLAAKATHIQDTSDYKNTVKALNEQEVNSRNSSQNSGSIGTLGWKDNLKAISKCLDSDPQFPNWLIGVISTGCGIVCSTIAGCVICILPLVGAGFAANVEHCENKLS